MTNAHNARQERETKWFNHLPFTGASTMTMKLGITAWTTVGNWIGPAATRERIVTTYRIYKANYGAGTKFYMDDDPRLQYTHNGTIGMTKLGGGSDGSHKRIYAAAARAGVAID